MIYAGLAVALILAIIVIAFVLALLNAPEDAFDDDCSDYSPGPYRRGGSFVDDGGDV